MNRRKLLKNMGLMSGLMWAGAAAAPVRTARAAPAPAIADMRQDIADLEARAGGRLGVALLDTASGAAFDWRGEERFAMCSTFKFLLAGHVLSRIDAGQERLDRTLAVPPKDKLIDWSPATEKQAGGQMSIDDLCNGIITLSDNSGANLLLDATGGPAALTAWIRTLGDDVTRCDRPEPEVNLVPPGEVRDTTTPLSMLGLMRTLLLGDALTPASRARLAGWLVANKTGDARLRAGLPKGWRIGDKTGSWSGYTNDIAIIWPAPDRGPLLVTAYYLNDQIDNKARNNVHAAIGTLIARHWAA